MREVSPGVFAKIGKKKLFYTINANRGKSVYGERRYREGGTEYRLWDPTKSKLCASLQKGIICTPKPTDAVLYLGASTGTTVSHVSDIVTKGIVFAVEFAARVARELVFLSKDRDNIAPIYGDAGKVETIAPRIFEIDWMFQDIAQRHQVLIFLKNAEAFVKTGGICVLAVKARSINAIKDPRTVFNQVKHELTNCKFLKIESETYLGPYQKDHCLFVCKKI